MNRQRRKMRLRRIVRITDSKILVMTGITMVNPPFLNIISPGSPPTPFFEKSIKSRPRRTKTIPVIMKNRPIDGIAQSKNVSYSFFEGVSVDDFLSFGVVIRSFFFCSAGCGSVGFL